MTTPHFSKKSALSNKEGLTYKEIFGEDYFKDFREFYYVEYQAQILDVQALTYYRITDDDYFQFMTVYFTDDEIDQARESAKTEKSIIESQFRYNYDLTFKENILKITEEILDGRSFYESLPTVFRSEYITDEEFKEIKHKICNKPKIMPKNSPLLKFMKKNDLYPYAYDSEKGLFLSRCVNSNSHQLFISIEDGVESWGCGYCRKKGGLEELKQWILEKKQTK